MIILDIRSLNAMTATINTTLCNSDYGITPWPCKWDDLFTVYLLCHALFYGNEHTVSDVLISFRLFFHTNVINLMTLP